MAEHDLKCCTGNPMTQTQSNHPLHDTSPTVVPSPDAPHTVVEYVGWTDDAIAADIERRSRGIEHWFQQIHAIGTALSKGEGWA
jgi:hypothetical protein